MTVDDDEMRRFVARLFGRDPDPDAASPSRDPDAALRKFAHRLFHRPDDDKG